MANYTQPDAVEQRVRFFDGQFLQDQDFIDEQKYHLDRERRLSRVLRISGVVEGLGVSTPKANQVAVAAGTAIDGAGRQLVLASARTLDLPAATFNNQQGIRLCIIYDETAVEPATTGSSGERRWLERPKIAAITLDGKATEPWDEKLVPVLLAELRLDGNGQVTVDSSAGQYAGLRLPGSLGIGTIDPAGYRLKVQGGNTYLDGTLTVSGATSLNGNVTVASNATLTVNGATNLGGGLTVSGNSTLNGNVTVASNATLTANGATNLSALTVSGTGVSSFAGSVGIGTTSPGARLDVSGGKIKLDGNQQLVFTDADMSNNLKLQLWSGYGLGINGGTLFYAANGKHSWRDNNGQTEWMALTTAANGGLTVNGTGNSSFAGNVGIGTTDPRAALEIAKGTTNDLALKLRSSGPGWGSGMMFTNTASGAKTYGLYAGADGKWHFADVDGGIDRLLIDQAGKVGIGTPAPSAQLQVVGNIIVTGMVYCVGGIAVYTGAPGHGFMIGPGGVGLMPSNGWSQYTKQGVWQEAWGPEKQPNGDWVFTPMPR